MMILRFDPKRPRAARRTSAPTAAVSSFIQKAQLLQLEQPGLAAFWEMVFDCALNEKNNGGRPPFVPRWPVR